MAESRTESAFTNPFVNSSSDEQGTEERPSPNPFAAPQRDHSPGNPFKRSSPVANHRDSTTGNRFSSSGTSEPMQPTKLEDIFASSDTEDHSNPQDLPAFDIPGAPFQYDDNGIAPYSDVSPWKCSGTSGANGTVDGSSDANGFSDGFGDDFGAMSQTEVIFNTGLVSNDFKAVAVTAEEDDLWSSSFTLESTTASELQDLDSSRDTESAIQGIEFYPTPECASETHHVPFSVSDGHSGATGIDDSIEVDLLSEVQAGLFKAGIPNPWNPCLGADDAELKQHSSPEDQVQEPLEQDHQSTDQILVFPQETVESPSSSVLTSATEPSGPGVKEETENDQTNCRFDFQSRKTLEASRETSVQSQDPWDCAFPEDLQEQGEHSVDSFGDQDPWTPNRPSSVPVLPENKDLTKPKIYNELSSPLPSNPFASQGQIDSIPVHSESTSPFQPQTSNPFQPPTGDDPFHYPTSEAFLDSANGSRSPNPFSLEESANPFLVQLDLLPQKEKEESLNKYLSSLKRQQSAGK